MPVLRCNQAIPPRSSFDPLVLADGETDLFVVVPEYAIEHVKDWLRLWVAIPNAAAGKGVHPGSIELLACRACTEPRPR